MTAASLGELVESGVSRVIDGEPQWLTDARTKARSYLEKHAFPGRKHEDWRYVRLADFYEQRFVPASPGESPYAADDAEIAALLTPIPDLGGTRIVHINGRYAPSWSRVVACDGLTVRELSHSIGIDDDFAREEFPWKTPAHSFDALNTLWATTGVQITVQEGHHCEVPVHWIHVFTTNDAAIAANVRNIVHVGAGASLRLVASTCGAPEAVGFLNSTTRVVLAEGAELQYRDIQDQSLRTYHFGLLDVTQHASSRLLSHVNSLGGTVARHEIHVRQVGEDSFTQLDGIFIPTGEQQHDHPIVIEHFASGGVSRETYRGVVNDRGHGVFNGRIIVHPGTQRIDADQSNKNLLLSDTAEIDTRPRLEISADDVKATHGASVGRLNDDQLFYLRSRGIPIDEARQILTYAFITEVVERLGSGPLHDRITSLVNARIAPQKSGARSVGL